MFLCLHLNVLQLGICDGNKQKLHFNTNLNCKAQNMDFWQNYKYFYLFVKAREMPETKS